MQVIHAPDAVHEHEQITHIILYYTSIRIDFRCVSVLKVREKVKLNSLVQRTYMEL